MPELNYNPIEVAIGTVAILVAAIIIFTKVKPSRAIVGGVYWTANEYFKQIKTRILLADNITELRSYKASIEGFRVKTFREFLFRWDRRKYYKQLKEAYDQKERNLILHPKPQQLCKS